MNKTLYKLSTILYGIICIIALVLGIYFAFQQRWFLVIIAALMIWTCIDNFFCGERMCNAGYNIKTHYSIPPFLKKK